MTDPIADMLTRIKNAYAAGHKTVKFPHSKILFSLAEILEREKFLEKVEKKGRAPKRSIECTLRYTHGLAALEAVKRISKPSRRFFIPAAKLKPSKRGYGIFILSTNQGLLTDKEARKKKVGGEVLCEVW